MYGQAEASPRIAYLDPKKNLQKLGSIGKPLKGYKLIIKKKSIIKTRKFMWRDYFTWKKCLFRVMQKKNKI